MSGLHAAFWPPVVKKCESHTPWPHPKSSQALCSVHIPDDVNISRWTDAFKLYHCLLYLISSPLRSLLGSLPPASAHLLLHQIPSPTRTWGLLGSPRPCPPSQHEQGAWCARSSRPSPSAACLPACTKPALMLWAETVFTSCSLLTGFTVLAGDTFHSQEEPATWRRSTCSAGFLRSQTLP